MMYTVFRFNRDIKEERIHFDTDFIESGAIERGMVVHMIPNGDTYSFRINASPKSAAEIPCKVMSIRREWIQPPGKEPRDAWILELALERHSTSFH